MSAYRREGGLQSVADDELEDIDGIVEFDEDAVADEIVERDEDDLVVDDDEDEDDDLVCVGLTTPI